jgi:hypothetical protein
LTTLSDASGSEAKTVSRHHHELPTETNQAQADDTATAILKKKKKPNSLM